MDMSPLCSPAATAAVLLQVAAPTPKMPVYTVQVCGLGIDMWNIGLGTRHTGWWSGN